MADDKTFKVLAVNRLARHEYEVLETMEAGIVLTGTEIKSARNGKVNIREAFARRTDGELWLYGAHIATYDPAGKDQHDPTRARKLLLHREQIAKLAYEVESKKLTLVPLKIYIKRHRAKVDLALVRGRKQYDKREVIAKRDAERDIRRAMRRPV